jgi:hypothetical protein
MAQPPASIRYNNPGAQYPGPSARKFGSIGTEVIGGGHKIAVFDDPVRGAAAQFDLLDRGYAGMTLGQAIQKWSGGNSSPAYAAHISKATGIPLDSKLTPEMLRDPNVAVPFAKASADWEAGGKYPMTDEQWKAAHAMAFGGQQPSSGTAVAGIGGNATASPSGDHPMLPLLASLFGMTAPAAAGAAGTAAAGTAAGAAGTAGAGAAGGIPLGGGFSLGGMQSGQSPAPKGLAPDPMGGMGQEQQAMPDMSRLMAVLQQRRRFG